MAKVEDGWSMTSLGSETKEKDWSEQSRRSNEGRSLSLSECFADEEEDDCCRQRKHEYQLHTRTATPHWNDDDDDDDCWSVFDTVLRV